MGSATGAEKDSLIRVSNVQPTACIQLRMAECDPTQNCKFT